MRTREFPSADRQESHGYRFAVGAIHWQPDAGSKGKLLRFRPPGK